MPVTALHPCASFDVSVRLHVVKEPLQGVDISTPHVIAIEFALTHSASIKHASPPHKGSPIDRKKP